MIALRPLWARIGAAARRPAPVSDAVFVALFAAAVRGAWVAWAAGRFPPAEDGHFYHVVAQRIAAGDGYTWLWPDGAVTYAAHYPIGYPALAGALYSVFGARPGVVMGLQALLGAASVAATHRLAASRTGRFGALLAALLVALSPGLVAYTAAFMTEGVVAALLVIAGWLVLAVRRATTRRARLAWSLGLGLLLGAATLVRPQSLLLAPVFGAVAWLPSTALRLARLWRPALAGALVASVALLTCLPWTVRNCARLSRCVFVSANGGWNLLIGATDGATGSWVPIEGKRVPLACRTVFDEAEKDACFAGAAVDRIRDRPVAWLGLVPAKLAATFDYVGAAAFYLHSSNPAAFGADAKLRLGVWETAWHRLTLLLALLAVARPPVPLGVPRRLGAGVSLLFLLQRAAWVAHVGLVASAALLGKAALRNVPLLLAVSTLALTLATHAVFFGAGRYALVCSPLLAALAGTLCVGPADPEPL